MFRREQRVHVLHHVLEGTVHLVRQLPNGSAVVLQRARPGAILAEASLFSERYHCDAISVTQSRTRVVRKATLTAALQENPDLLRAWSAHLAREIQAARQRAEILALKTVAERLDAWIGSNDGLLPAKGGWRTVATEIGTSPEALYRELAARRRGGKG